MTKFFLSPQWWRVFAYIQHLWARGYRKHVIKIRAFDLTGRKFTQGWPVLDRSGAQSNETLNSCISWKLEKTPLFLKILCFPAKSDVTWGDSLRIFPIFLSKTDNYPDKTLLHKFFGYSLSNAELGWFQCDRKPAKNWTRFVARFADILDLELSPKQVPGVKNKIGEHPRN